MSNLIHKGGDKKLRCKLGFHKWGRWRGISLARSNIIDKEKKCKSCGEIRRKTTKKPKYEGW